MRDAGSTTQPSNNLGNLGIIIPGPWQKQVHIIHDAPRYYTTSRAPPAMMTTLDLGEWEQHCIFPPCNICMQPLPVMSLTWVLIIGPFSSDATPTHKTHARRPRRRRGWRPNSQTKRLYQSLLNDRLHHTKPQTLKQLEECVRVSAVQAESHIQPSTDIRPWEKEDFRALLRERRHCKNALEKARTSKLVRKQLRFHMRQRRNAKLNEILSEFRDLGRLNVIHEEGMKRQQSTSEQPSPDDCADLFEDIFASETDSHDPLVHACPQPFDENLVDESVPIFQSAELLLALQQLRQGKFADSDGLVLETFSDAGAQLHQCLLDIYNKMPAKNEWDPTWYHTIFTMLPKPGDTSLAQNWRPIAVLKVTYKILAKMLHSRLQPILDSRQAPDQVGFRPHRGTEHALGLFDTTCGKSIEWNCDLWFASLDRSHRTQCTIRCTCQARGAIIMCTAFENNVYWTTRLG